MTPEDYAKIFHEIKNYITCISSSLQLIEKTHPEVTDYPYWKDTISDVWALKKMVIEISSARLCSKLNTEMISLNSFFAELKNSYTALCGSKDFLCSFKTEPDLPELPIDSDRLKRAIFNLIKNSYEAMDGTGEITVSARSEADFVCIDVIDSGGGISPDYLEKIVTPFSTTKQTGTGLGLLITKQTVEAHGGHLSVDSRPHDGCTFSIYLPVQ